MATGVTPDQIALTVRQTPAPQNRGSLSEQASDGLPGTIISPYALELNPGVPAVTPLILLVALATPQIAVTSTNTGTDQAINAGTANKKTCRFSKQVGSQIPQRICHTQAEWRTIDNADEVNRSRIMEGRRFSGQ